jgi:hypothetical protein
MARATITRGGGAGAKESASAALIAEAAAEVVVNTPNGLAITLKKPGVLAPFRLVKMLGETATNQTYMRMVLPFLFVVAIDGEPQPFPQSEREIEALITRLDEPGIAMVMMSVQEHWGEIDAEATKDAIKK